MDDLDVRAYAMVALLLEAYHDGIDVTDSMTYVLRNIELNEDARKLILSLTSISVTAVVLLARLTGRDPQSLWTEIMEQET